MVSCVYGSPRFPVCMTCHGLPWYDLPWFPVCMARHGLPCVRFASFVVWVTAWIPIVVPVGAMAPAVSFLGAHEEFPPHSNQTYLSANPLNEKNKNEERKNTCLHLSRVRKRCFLIIIIITIISNSRRVSRMLAGAGTAVPREVIASTPLPCYRKKRTLMGH